MTASPVEPLSSEDAEWIIDCKGLSNTQRAALAAIRDGKHGTYDKATHRACKLLTEQEAKDQWFDTGASNFVSVEPYVTALRVLGLIREESTNG